MTQTEVLLTRVMTPRMRMAVAVVAVLTWLSTVVPPLPAPVQVQVR